MFQNLYTVDLRHHDIEQHQVRHLFLDACQCLGAARRADSGVTLPLQVTHEKITVFGDVVNDKNPRPFRVCLYRRIQHVPHAARRLPSEWITGFA